MLSETLSLALPAEVPGSNRGRAQRQVPAVCELLYPAQQQCPLYEHRRPEVTAGTLRPPDAVAGVKSEDSPPPPPRVHRTFTLLTSISDSPQR